MLLARTLTHLQWVIRATQWCLPAAISRLSSSSSSSTTTPTPAAFIPITCGRKGGPPCPPRVRFRGPARWSVYLAALLLAACHAARRPPAPAPAARPDASALTSLRRDLDAILAQPTLERGYWGVLVKSLSSGETLYERDA